MTSEKRGGYRQGPARRTVPKTIDLSPGEVRVSGGEAEAASAVSEELAHASDRTGTPDPEQAADPAIEPVIEPAIAQLAEPSGDPAMTGQDTGAISGDGTTGKEDTSEPDPAPRRKSRLRFALPAMAGIVLAVAVLGGLYQTGLFSGIEPVPDPARPPVEPAASGLQAQIDAFSARFAALEQELAGLRAAPGASAFQIEKLGGEIREYSARLSKAEQALRTLETKPQAPVGAGQLQSLEQRLATAEKAIAEPGRGEIGQGAGLGAKLDNTELEAALAKMAERNDALEARIGALESGLQARANAADAERDAQAGIARASIAGALKNAFERGEPFSELLASAAALAGDAPAISRLKAHAAKGVATSATLQNSFLAAMDEVNAALQPQPEGVVAQLIANAKSLIRVRPSGPQPGDSAEAILSRIEAALASGRLDAALGEWEKLPGIAKPALDGWAGQLRERIDAGQYLGELLGLLGESKAG